MKKLMEHYYIKEGFAEMDFDAVTRLLAATHWSLGISRAEVEKASSNSSLVVGIFNEADEQIGFARLVSDKTRFAYFMDVIITPELRSSGIGEQMIQYMLNHPDYTDVYQWMLVTTYAHDFYEKCGFVRTNRAENLMERVLPRNR